jgi:phosphatidylglycerol---prolipoprotein diacylglyceryl transferase
MWLHSFQSPIPHIALETLAYCVAASVYWARARISPVAKRDAATRWVLLGGAVFGAMVGSKVLHILEHLPALREAGDAALWMGGKSVLGGFLGGTLMVELCKRLSGVRVATGDPWVAALAVGLVIGRIGCQLSGTWDQTYGSPTLLPWAWNYGDNIGRHPVALYEIACVGFAFAVSTRVISKTGASFALFLCLYCLGRLGLEFFKPPFGTMAVGTLPVALYGELTAIQWAACFGILWYGALLRVRLRR